MQELFKDCFYPIWHYGKYDCYMQEALMHMIVKLIKLDDQNKQTVLLKELMAEIDQIRTVSYGIKNTDEVLKNDLVSQRF